MNLRKKIFVFGGSFLIIAILTFRFGLWDKIKKLSNAPKKPNVVKVLKTPPPQAPEIPAKTVLNALTAPAKKKLVSTPVVKSKAVLPPIAPKKAKTTQVTTSQPNQSTPESTTWSDKAAFELGLGNPFSYSNSDSGSYSPLSGNKQVGLIAIKGIVKFKDSEAWALLHLKETDRVYYVKRGDVIRISSKSANGIMPTEAYIVVKEVRDNEVELIQQERPDKVIIVR